MPNQSLAMKTEFLTIKVLTWPAWDGLPLEKKKEEDLPER